MEYAAAKSSICRQCGRSFSPFVPKPGLKLRTREEAPPPESSSILSRFEDFWKRQRSSIIECFECKRKQQVCGAATSTICPACSAHIDLRDYKITSGFSRTIRTRGDVHLTSRGDLGSSSVDRKADIHCFRSVRAESVEIRGRMSGEIVAQTMVMIHKRGSLEGDVTARAITVEKGGMFSGQLVIGQVGLTQGELLQEQEPAAATGPESNFPETAPRPLPAT